MLAILLRPLVCCSQPLAHFWLSNISILSVPDEGYSRHASCALNLISTHAFVFLNITQQEHPGQHKLPLVDILKRSVLLAPEQHKLPLIDILKRSVLLEYTVILSKR
jgi:hypothetical protein